MKTSRKRKTTRTSGRRLFLAALLLALSGAAADDYAIIAGTVFRDTGHACPGAEVILESVPSEGEKKSKPQKQISTFRGEFSFRVPAKPMRYTVSVKASGYRPQSKPVTIQGDERIDISVLLDREKP